MHSKKLSKANLEKLSKNLTKKVKEKKNVKFVGNLQKIYPNFLPHKKMQIMLTKKIWLRKSLSKKEYLNLSVVLQEMTSIPLLETTQ